MGLTSEAFQQLTMAGAQAAQRIADKDPEYVDRFEGDTLTQLGAVLVELNRLGGLATTFAFGAVPGRRRPCIELVAHTCHSNRLMALATRDCVSVVSRDCAPVEWCYTPEPESPHAVAFDSARAEFLELSVVASPTFEFEGLVGCDPVPDPLECVRAIVLWTKTSDVEGFVSALQDNLRTPAAAFDPRGDGSYPF